MTQQAGTRFVGRAREVRELLEALDDAVSGRGRLILLGGEPGIGKSRLADELAAQARARGHQVLWGRGWEDAGAPPYWPWVQALRVHLRSGDPRAVRRQLGSGAADVAQMLPELRDLFPDLPGRTDFESESARFQLFDSTATFLRNAASHNPLLIVLDDLQAADTPSILFLRFLATQLGDMPLLVVGTYRDVELTPDHPLTAAVAELAREPVTRVMSLSGLPAEAVREYIGATVDMAPHDHLVAAVWRATNGNPLFVGEAVRLLSAEGRLADVADLASLRVAVPAGVRAVIARRIGHLSEATAGTLQLGAVLGPEFSLEVLRRIGDLEPDIALELVDEAVQAGLLLPVAGAIGRYRFSHDLVRETLYDELSTNRRTSLHRRIAEALEAVHAASIDAHLAELAFHHVEAVREGQGGLTDAELARLGPKAIEYARRAGEKAARSLAYEEAARLYHMALAVLDLPGQSDDEARTETLLALGDVQTRAGSLDDASTAFLEAARIARRRGAGQHLARASLGFGGRHSWTRSGKEMRLIPLLQDALVMLGGNDDRLRVRLLTRLACAWRSDPERRDDSAALSGQAIEIARGLDDPASLGYALIGRFWATFWPENPADREAVSRELVVVAQALGDPERIIDAHMLRYISLSELGRTAEMRVEVATLRRVVEELRQPAQLWLEPTSRGQLALLLGDFDTAEEVIARAIGSGYQMSPASDDVSAARFQRFLLRRAQGRVAEEEATLRASIDDFPWYPVHRAALVCLLIDVGRDIEARAMFAEIAAGGFHVFNRDNEWLLGMSLASEACALLGDAPAAAQLYDELTPFAGRHAIAHGEGSVGAVDRYLGLLAATLGRLDAAARHLSDAIEINRRAEARPWAATAQHDLAEVLRQLDGPGNRERAAALDREARGTALELGMALADRITPDPAMPVEWGTGGPAAGRQTETGVGETSDAPAGPVAAATFLREGEYWTVEFGGQAFRVRDSKGMGHLARLLRMPGQEIHALELARGSAVLATGLSSSASSTEDALAADALADAGPILDAEAKAAYRQRLDEIREELAEAAAWNDPERVVRLQADEAALARELSGALGLGGRDRPTASASERARVSVTRAIRAALGRIAEQSKPLGDHFEATIRTGTFCSYVPDPRAPITWRL